MFRMTPLIREVDYIDSSQVLLRLADEPMLCFLDSAKQQSTLGRYSYIGVAPFLTIKSKENILFINEEQLIGNPFDLLKKHLLAYKGVTVKNLPPFQGGAMGYLAYDLLHHLERVPQAKKDKIKIPDMYIGFYDCIVAFDHLRRRTWIISQGFPELEERWRHCRAEDRANWLFNKAFETRTPEINISWEQSAGIDISSNFSLKTYCDAIKKTIEYIYAGDIFQANITQCFSSVLPNNVSSIELYMALRVKNPAPFSAFLNFGDICIASASPERFICLQSGIVETRPIKGTRPRGKTAVEDELLANELVNSEKDHAENTMIVDLMRNDLSRVCSADSVVVHKLCGLESYETVHHLVSVIEAKLAEGKDAIDLLKATFPGGSITGAPKVRAMEIIYEIEPFERAVYCGNIGYIGFDGNMDTSIVIRTYIIKEGRVYFQAGGGIVADSNPQEEYEESLIKAHALKKVLQGKEKMHDLVYR